MEGQRTHRVRTAVVVLLVGAGVGVALVRRQRLAEATDALHRQHGPL